jgi:cellulose synthase/poly-beta-1,6-N-acetylglucosamine synthase-like glycosyltransferase
VTILIALILALPTLLTFCFAIELLAGLRPLRQAEAPSAAGRRAVIVVPAHNEAEVIGGTLASLKEAAGNRVRILVVADNCTDDTAAIARSAGVDVLERRDPQLRGKGFAIDFARTELRRDPPDVVLVIDADCRTDRATIEQLINRCAASGHPCQAIYLQAPAPDAPPTVQLSTFAFYVRNVLRQRGLQRLAGRVHLVGTGMAFPWTAFASAALATGNIVEDLELGLELAATGYRPLLVEHAIVLSDAASERNTVDQRRRWEGGFLQSARVWAPKLLASSISDRDAGGLWAAVSLMIPPLALLLLLDAALLVAVAVLGGAAWPFLTLSAAVGFAGVGLVLAWAGGGRRFAGWKTMARAPLYVLWKIPMYAGFVRRGAPSEWQRTGRR